MSWYNHNFENYYYFDYKILFQFLLIILSQNVKMSVHEIIKEFIYED